MSSQSQPQSHTVSLATVWQISSAATIATGLFVSPALAQPISIDGSTSTLLNIDNSCTNNCTITITGTSRDGNGSGPNLFHSFSTFNVETDSTVTFTAPGITNIFSRVTGTNPSNIDGALTVDGTANLFLLNANGILFGENATLDLDGSFLSSTADSLVFEGENQLFSASPATMPSLLNINVPLGLQFGSSPNPIDIQGNGHNLTYSSRNFTIGRDIPTTSLTAAAGKTLAFLGGGVTIQGGNLIANEGQLAVSSLGNNAFVPFTSTESGWNFDYSETINLGDINLSQQASLDVSGDDAGLAQLQGRQINISEGSAIIANISGQNASGHIAINASESLNLTGVNLSATQRMPTGAYVEISPGATGDGTSQISVNTPNLTLTAGAQIGLSMAGSGRSGSVDIEASNIIVDGGSNATPSGLFAAVLPVFGPPPGAEGQGGDLNINGGLDINGDTLRANRLSVTNGAVVSAETFGAGNAGNLNINAKDIEVLGFSETAPNNPPSSILSSSRVRSIPPLPSGSGNGGTITIDTERLVVAEGGVLSVATNSPNVAGDITIQASESVELRGNFEQGRSGIFALARVGPGTGGNIEITTDQLSILEGATINAGNFSSSETSTNAPGTGPAGNIQIAASNIILKDDSLITTDTVIGDRANITIQSDSLVLRNGSNITTNATGSATGSTGSATGGNITIDTDALIALENSDITANANDNFGGRIVVTAETILGTTYREQLTAESDITASSGLGPAFSGSVELNSPEIDPTDGLTELPEGLVAADQIAAACEKLDSNTFVATGRGGLPDGTSQLSTNPSIWNDFRLIENENSFLEYKSNTVTSNHESQNISTINSTTETSNIVEAQTWSVNPEGTIVLGTNTETTVASQPSTSCLANV